jgi:hypothetical protein
VCVCVGNREAGVDVDILLLKTCTLICFSETVQKIFHSMLLKTCENLEHNFALLHNNMLAYNIISLNIISDVRAISKL